MIKPVVSEVLQCNSRRTMESVRRGENQRTSRTVVLARQRLQLSLTSEMMMMTMLILLCMTSQVNCRSLPFSAVPTDEQMVSDRPHCSLRCKVISLKNLTDFQGYAGWPKIGTIVLYALTSTNINRFSELFHHQNQENFFYRAAWNADAV